YFEQSEQLKTRLWLFANATQAVGLLLQELPAQDNYKTDWERLEILANTVTEQELFELDCEQLLYRLFNQEKVRLFDAEPVEFSCTCSRSKIEQVLFAMGRAELEDILTERDNIEVNCEFCSEHYHFNKADIETILSRNNTVPESETRH
ncbi:MAG: Hsp33 family molecular chaperone HslO, partial [Methylobacter sp.]